MLYPEEIWIEGKEDLALEMFGFDFVFSRFSGSEPHLAGCRIQAPQMLIETGVRRWRPGMRTHFKISFEGGEPLVMPLEICS